MRRLTFDWLGKIPCASLALGIALLFSARAAALPVGGGLTADPSLGTVVTPSGNNFLITGGTLRGASNANLFQSFSQFNVGTSQTATFVVPASVLNIIARVTGQNVSFIDGTITTQVAGTSSVGSANLFLINPNGVMFGANAQINLGGAFTVTSATYAKLSDGGIFYAQLGANDSLTSAPVSGFGFLNAAPAPISFAGSQITNAGGLHVLGGNLTFDQGSTNGTTEQSSVLSAPSGYLTLFSTASAGEVPFSLASPGSGFVHATTPSFGNITLNNQSKLKIDGSHGGGGVVIRGGQLVMNDSQISSKNSGAVAGGPISMQGDSLTMTGATFSSTTTNGTITESPIVADITAQTSGAGAAGALTFNLKDSMTLTGGASIDVQTTGNGNGGNVTVTTPTLTMDGAYFLPNDPNNHFKASQTQIKSITEVPAGTGNGNAGSVTLNVTDLSITNGAQVTAQTDDHGKGGTLTINALGTIKVAGAADQQPNNPRFNILYPSTINSQTFGTGAAGAVTVHGKAISLLDTATISASSVVSSFTKSANVGSAGTVTVTADSLVISGSEVQQSPDEIHNLRQMHAGVTSATGTNGSAGSVVVRVNGTLTVSGGGNISAASQSNGQSGAVTVIAGTLNVDGIFTNPFVPPNPSAIGSSANAGHVNGGTVDITVGGTLSLTNGGTIKALSVGGNAGVVTIDAASVILENGGQINTTARRGGGGDIVMNVENLFYSNTGQVTTASDTSGGNITIDPQFVVLDNAIIKADATLNGGAITIITDNFLSSDSFITASGGVSNGAISISSPDLDLSSALASLPAALTDNSDRLRENCATAITHEYSSLIQVGRGGTESSPTELQAEFGVDAN